MERWYGTNYDKPYPTEQVIHQLSMEARLTVRQARKWLANRRVRSNNTLVYNQNIHPKRERRLEKDRLALFGLAAAASQHHIKGIVKVPSVFGFGMTPGQGTVNSWNSTTGTSTISQESLIAEDSRMLHGQNNYLSNLRSLSFPSSLSTVGSNHASSSYHQSPLDVNTSTLSALRLYPSLRQQSQHQLPTYYYGQSSFGAPCTHDTTPSVPGNGTAYF